jgi:hypothetical protein
MHDDMLCYDSTSCVVCRKLFREEEFRPATFYIFDARSMLAAMANMAAGRGTEEVR